MKSGLAVSSSPNSSITTNRCGSGARSEPGLPQGAVVRDVGDVAGVLQHLLAALHLAGEAGVDALDQPGVVLQVGDHPGECGTCSNGAKVAPPL